MVTFKESAEAEFAYNEAQDIFLGATVKARAEYLSMLGAKALMVTNAEVDEAVRNNPEVRTLFEASVAAYKRYKLLIAELDQDHADKVQRDVEAFEKIARQAVLISQQLTRLVDRTD